MKILTIVGIRKSGKTSTTEALLKEIARRGLKAGTCKTIFCPSFSIDKPDSNTARHLRAGSMTVCARARHETAFIHGDALPLSEIAARFAGMDYLILQGDYLSPVSRIVCAHNEADALPRINDLTFACSGRISAADTLLPVPAVNAMTDVAALLDLIDAKVPDTAPGPWLDEPLPPVPGVTGDGFCQCGCHHHEKKLNAVSVTVNGKELKLTPEQEALLRSWADEAKAHE